MAATQHVPPVQENVIPEVHGDHKQMFQLGDEGVIHQAGDGRKSSEINHAGALAELEGDATAGAQRFSYEKR